MTMSMDMSAIMKTNEYILEHAVKSTTGRRRLLPDPYWTTIPDEIRAELVKRYGQPATIDRGEVAYWTIDDYDNSTSGGSERSGARVAG